MPNRSQSSVVSNPPFFRRNLFLHSAEGGLYMGGMAFVAGDTVLPALIDSLGGPAWLISLMPVMGSLGFVLPPIFTAHLIQKMPMVKPIVTLTGTIQRLPYLVSGLALLWLSGSFPLAALAAVALAPFLSGAAGGLTVTAWQELVAKTIPSHRLSSLWAIRNSIGALMGITGGGVIAAILHRYPGPTGFAYLHLITFACLAVSFGFFTFIRETGPSQHAKAKALSFRENVQSMPALVRGDPQLRNFIITRALINGIYIAIPFLAIHALHTTGKPQSHIGFLITVQMIGGITGNLLAGFLGDRFGGKKAVGTGIAACLLAFLLPIGGKSEILFLLIFFLLGVSVNCVLVGLGTLSFEIAHPPRRSTYFALMSVINFPTMLLASGIATLLRSTNQSFTLMCALSLLCLAFSAVFLLRIENPRKKRESIPKVQALSPEY